MPEPSNAHIDERDFLEAAPAEILDAFDEIDKTFSKIGFNLSEHYPYQPFHKNMYWVLLQMVSAMGGRTAEPLSRQNARVKRLLPRVDFEELRALVVEFAADPMDPNQPSTLKRVTWKFHDSEEVNLKMYSSLAVFEQLLKLRELMCATQSTDRYNFSVQECVHFDKRGWGSAERLLYRSVLASFWDPATLDAKKQYDVLDEPSQLYTEVDRKGGPLSMVRVRLKIDYDK